MPTYEYECPSCGRAFERFQKMVDDPVKDCPFDGCNGQVRRLVSAGAGVIFKGSGFYETDYKRKSNGKESEKPASSPASEAKSCPNTKASAPASKGD